jgi:hypothetical protein
MPCESSCRHAVLRPLSCVKHREKQAIGRCYKQHRVALPLAFILRNIFSDTLSEARFQRHVVRGKSSTTSSRQPALGNQLLATSRPQPVLGCQFSAPSMPSPAILASRMRQSAFLRSLGKRLSTPPPWEGGHLPHWRGTLSEQAAASGGRSTPAEAQRGWGGLQPGLRRIQGLLNKADLLYRGGSERIAAINRTQLGGHPTPKGPPLPSWQACVQASILVTLSLRPVAAIAKRSPAGKTGVSATPSASSACRRRGVVPTAP